MRKILLGVAAMAAILMAGAVAERAQAIPIGATGIRAAADEVNSITAVNCRPGWRHHLANWGWWDGCVVRSAPVLIVRPRPVRRRVIIVR